MKIVSNRTMFCLARKSDWCFIQNRLVARRIRLREFFHTRKRFWRLFALFFNRWQRLWHIWFCNSLIWLSKRTFRCNLFFQLVWNRESLIVFCSVEFHRVFFFDFVNSFVTKNSFVFENFRQNSCFVNQQRIVFVFHDCNLFVSIKIFYDFFVWTKFQNLNEINNVFYAIHDDQI